MGWTVSEFSLDFAYQFRSGEEVTGPNPGLPDTVGYRIEDNCFVILAIIYFRHMG